jgi:pyrroline-5-carboxylate reductase
MTNSTSIGFIGTGDITHAIVTGLMAHAQRPYEIWVSPRNERLSAELAQRHPQVRVARDNQDVVARAETVFLAVRPQVAPDVLGELSFSPNQCAVSLIAGYGIEKTRAALGAAPSRIARALPLLMVARAAARTVLYPVEPAVREIFDAIGGTIAVEDERQYDTMLALSASMGQFFATAHVQSAWAQERGVQYQAARAYLLSLYRGLVETALADETPLDDLSRHFSTKGGINEQVVAVLREGGAFDLLASAYDKVEERVRTPDEG